MCECLTYNDEGAAYLCEVCAGMIRDAAKELDRANLDYTCVSKMLIALRAAGLAE